MPLPIRGASRGRVVFVLLLLSVTLITISVRGSAQIDGARSTSRDWFSPVRDTFGKVFRPFENVWHGVRDYDKLRQDYLALKDQVSRDQGVAIEAETQVKENNELRAQFGLFPCSAIPRKTAEVVGRPATNYEASLEINIGSDDGVKRGMPVVTPAGLVGRIGEVSANHAFVQLMFDTTFFAEVNVLGTANASKTPKQILEEAALKQGGIVSLTTTTTIAGQPTATTTTAPPGEGEGNPTEPPTTVAAPTTTVGPTTTTTLVTNERGLVRGNGRGKPLTVEFTRGVENVRAGDPVATAGSDASLFPSCIPVGRVKSVTPKKGSNELEVVVEPVADLDRIGLVSVILYDPERRVAPSTTAPPVQPAQPIQTEPTTPP
jgi:cell shape-determining protein MreC